MTPLDFLGSAGADDDEASGLVASKLIGVAKGEVCLEPVRLEVLRRGKIVGPVGVLGPEWFDDPENEPE
jgi:hypothetical protein